LSTICGEEGHSREAYLEHLTTSEAWARLPRDDLGGDSFQSRLRAMTPAVSPIPYTLNPKP